MDFGEFFITATGGNTPYDYQCRLACGRDADSHQRTTLLGGTDCSSRLINIPTGLGKTAAVTLAWLWNRVQLQNSEWPRRLVYCLPMRTLVEQTEREVRKWLEAHGLLWDEKLQTRKGKVGVHILMGGEDAGEWDIFPEENAILIGTQDMLLSRALNRGYGMSRYRWPMHFGLLNNDCLWVMDEVQLMGSGLSTSLQLQAWRENLTLRYRECEQAQNKLAPTLIPTHTWWMSATTAEHWLKKSVAIRSRVGALWKNRVQADPAMDAKKLYEIPKIIDCCRAVSLPDPGESGSGRSWDEYATSLANHLAAPENRKGKKRISDKEESENALTLVVCNTVERAIVVYDALKRLQRSKSSEPLFDENHLLLLHSRFRGNERRAWPDKLQAFEKGEGNNAGARIIVATQVIEAGVDISASLLYTEICPLSSLIQRLGRCARRADEAGKAFWIDAGAFKAKKPKARTASAVTEPIDFTGEQKAIARPYDAIEIDAARNALVRATDRAGGRTDVSIGQVLSTLLNHAELDDCPDVRTAFPFDPSLVPQTRDLFNLFDTTSDLSGADIDISRFIRDGDDLDVLVFWRDDNSGLGKGEFRNGRPFKKLLPARDELCPVSAWRFREFFGGLRDEEKKQVWLRDYRKGWVPVTDSKRIYPGQTFLLRKEIGGYDRGTGWIGKQNLSEFEACPPKEEPRTDGDSAQDDEENAAGEWESIHYHSVNVADALNRILSVPTLHNALERDGVLAPVNDMPPWHDVGKAHEKFLAKLTTAARDEWVKLAKDDHPAKAPKGQWKSFFHDAQDREETDRRFKRRRGFRHELASALALLETLRRGCPNHPAVKIEDELRAALSDVQSEARDFPDDATALAALGPIADLDRLKFNLLLFLIASHHGKVRLGLRSTEDDHDPDQLDPASYRLRRCLGVEDDDVVPACRLPDPSTPADHDSHVKTPSLTLSLDPMEAFSPLFGASWADRMRELLEVLGPFRLGYLEALIRAADARASIPVTIIQPAS